MKDVREELLKVEAIDRLSRALMLLQGGGHAQYSEAEEFKKAITRVLKTIAVEPEKEE